MRPFAGRAIVGHLARGASAAALVAFALWSTSAPTPLRLAGAVLASIGAVVLLRGCPICWAIGLIETINRSRSGKRA